MRRRRSKPSDEADIDMTPMLDIVFIMLIFFIVTATFLDETGINLTRPPDDSDGPPPPPKPIIRIYVDAQNQCSVDNIATVCERVPLQVEKLLAEKADASILMRLHEKSPHKTLVFLRDQFDGDGTKSKIEIVPAG